MLESFLLLLLLAAFPLIAWVTGDPGTALLLIVGGWGVIALPGAWLLFRQAPPFIPSSKNTVRTMIRLARIRPGEKAYDLGCGDGRIVLAAAAAGAHAVGYELSLPTFALARLRALFRPRATIRLGNFWQQDFSDADVIFCYLLMRPMRSFERRIWPTLKPGCRVVSHAFKMDNVKPAEEEGNVRVYVKT